MPMRAAPLIFELNARVFGRRFDDITQSDLAYFRRMGFSHLWLMGIWRISSGALTVSKRFESDFEGSPYAVPEYEFNSQLGDEASFRALRARAHQEGLRLIVDFVPNHLAFDAPLVDEHPEYFIRFDPEARDDRPDWYFATQADELIAHGRDPFFPPWVDTAQLDYSHPGLRRHMTELLGRLADLADGVRCDMAMLLLREQIKNQWYPYASWDWFNDRMPDEFWREAIAEARRRNPDFVFIAEAYWGKEPYLQELGFDYTYNKTLYDRIAGRGWDALVDYLELTAPEFLARSLHFIENHDEERAQHVFGHQLHRQAAVLVTTLPGAPMIHQGQMEGRREKLPVQIVRPRTLEQDDPVLQDFYRKLLGIASEPVFRAGRFHPFDSGIRGLVTFIREYERQRVLVAVDFRAERGLDATAGTLSIPRQFFPDLSEGEYRLRDTWNGEFERPARLGPSRMVVDLASCSDPHLPFCLLEILV